MEEEGYWRCNCYRGLHKLQYGGCWMVLEEKYLSIWINKIKKTQTKKKAKKESKIKPGYIIFP